MARVYQHQQDYLHIKSKEDRSIEVVTLKQSATVYGAGTVVVAEYAADVATGFYVDPAAAGIDISAYTKVIPAVLNDRVDASAANHEAVAIVRDAEVYGSLTSIGKLAGAELAAVATALADAHVVTR